MGSVTGAGCIVSLGRAGTRGIGLMGSMMGMGWRDGRGGVDTRDATGRGCGTDSGCTGSITGITTPGSGSAGKATGRECSLALMGAAIPGNSCVELSMGLAPTISGMVIDTVVSTLETKSMVSESIALLLATAMKAHGMKAGDKVLEYTHSEMVKRDRESGIVVF